MKICRQCGTEIFDGEEFCYSCGNIGEPVECTHEPMNKSNRWIALLLALIPGFFDVFGLGQLYLRSYFKAGLFLTISVVMYFAVPHYGVEKDSITYIGATMAIFLVQAMDVMNTIRRREQMKNV
jgi:TM2 domain-containing membrane protein YozV